MTLNGLEPPKYGVLLFILQFVAAAQISRVNCDQVDGDRTKQPVNTNC